MTQPRTLDSSSHDFAEALEEAESARHHLATYLEYRNLVRWYSSDTHGLTVSVALARVERLLAESVRAATEEQAALRKLNAVLLHAGGEVGDVFLVGRSMYHVCKPGQLAVYLGCELPGVSEVIAAYQGFDEPDDRADDVAAYSEMVHIPH